MPAERFAQPPGPGAEDLRDRLRKIEAVIAGAATPGERDAATAALERVRARLAEAARRDPPVELAFSVPDPWAARLFVALCRRYGLSPYRYPRQKRATVMLRVPRGFAQGVLWPEFTELEGVLRAHLSAVTERIIRDAVHDDPGEPEEVAGALPGR